MPELRSDVVFSLPCAMIQHLPFEQQIELVRAVGFQEMTLHPFYITDVTRSGLSLADMKRMVADAGLRVSRLDPLCTWAPAWRSWDLGPEYDITASMDSDLFLELSAFFGCRYLSLNAMWKPGFYTKPEMAGFYREICGKAAKFDIACDLEPLPMWGIQTIEDALEIIDLADVANPGLVFDVTHFVRGGSPISVLDEVPRGLIHTVQLCDGYQPARMTLEEECFNRLWPGTGDFDIASILEALDRNSGLNGVGPEVFSPAYAAGETTPAWIADRINESLARYPQLLADRGAGL